MFLKSNQCLIDLFMHLEEKLYMPSDLHLRYLDSIRPDNLHDMTWRYELRGFVMALIACGVTAANTLIWLDNILFGNSQEERVAS